jgi:hypothetical protein
LAAAIDSNFNSLLTVAGIALGIADRVVLVVAHVLGQLGFQRPLH